MLDYELLQKLCTSCGISGDEGEVRELILNEIKPFADEITVDASGNIIAFKKGRRTPAKKLLISAHMDEVGFIVTYITSDGCLKFDCVGGVNDSAAFSKNVKVGPKKLHGVVCAKPVHLLTADEKKKSPKIKDLLIDIGAESREEAEKYVSPGDSIVFDSLYENRYGRVISKAIDDRFGCLVLIELIRSELEYDTWFSFVVQEEIGLRGATVASYTTEPDIAFVLESTTASDIPEVTDDKKVCRLGHGAVVSYMDRHTIYDKDLYQLAFETAKQNDIAVQTKSVIAGGNDAGAIHLSKGGVRTAAISLPCRYLHSPSCVINQADMQSAYQLVKLLLNRNYDK